MKKLIIVLFIFAILLICFSIYAHIQIKKTAQQTTPSNIPYVIVLGAKVNGSEMSLSLLYRAKRALTYLKNNPNSKVIATGGQGDDEDITEAEAVRQFLLENGIDKDRILLEEKSTSTYDNLKFSKGLYDVDEAVIISNEFHLYRAIKNAETIGIKGYPLAAKTPNAVKWKLYLREYAAILKLTITGK